MTQCYLSKCWQPQTWPQSSPHRSFECEGPGLCEPSNHHCCFLTQSFSTWALRTFFYWIFLRLGLGGGHPVHCKVFNSIHGFYPLKTTQMSADIAQSSLERQNDHPPLSRTALTLQIHLTKSSKNPQQHEIRNLHGSFSPPMEKTQKNISMDFMNRIRKVQAERKGLIILPALKGKAFISYTKFPQPGRTYLQHSR